MELTFNTLLYTITILIIGFLMFNFNKIFGSGAKEPLTVTSIEKALI